VICAIVSTALSLGALRFLDVDRGGALARKRLRIVQASEVIFNQVTMTQAASIATSESRGARSDGSVIDYFLLEMTSMTDTPSMVLDWDEESGELIRCYTRLPIEAYAEGRTMCPEEAALISQSWLARLRIARLEPAWKLAGRPELRRNRTYWCQWIAPGLEVTIAAHAGTGCLLYLNVRKVRAVASQAGL
jgi:hypothetical protein